MKKFIFTTTGLVPIVKFEEIGSYFDHPTSAYTLTDTFDVEEISIATTIQTSLDDGEITAVDENGNSITNLSYLIQPTPVFEIDNYGVKQTYIGYGEINQCKISRVITLISGDYTEEWAGGNENFDKIWADRATYLYF